MNSDQWSIADNPGRKAFAPGSLIGVYRIEAPLGEGGMGTVYRALDTKLNRPVAIKVLSDDLADAAARRRFQREAQTASSLNHPHIVTVYDVGELEGRQYIVTEFVDGGTLKDWAQQEQRTWRQIVELLTGVADGLAAAHTAGILHRDIKPANILVAKNGYAKLADFGLAKLAEPETSRSDATITLTEATRPGMIVGTVAYMSPEQASGRALDARSDIFSFGVLLYEQLGGRRPFTGASDLEVLKTVIHGDAEPLSDGVPLALRMAVEKALAKDPAERYQTMRDLVVDLRRSVRSKTIDTSAETAVLSTTVMPRRSRVPWALAVAVGLASLLAGYVIHAAMTRRIPKQNVQVQRLTDFVGLEESPAISPDGKTVAFVAETKGRRQIWVRLLSGGTPLAITKDDADHLGPRWSPDSSTLIYFTAGAGTGDAGTIWEIPALGGTARRLVSALGPGDISHDGKRLAFIRFREGTTELAISELGQSDSRTVTQLASGFYSNLRWSPDDRKLALLDDPGGAAFYTNLVVADAAGGEPRRVAGGDVVLQGFAWTPEGTHLIVSSAKNSTMNYPPTYNLWAIPRDGSMPSQLTFGEFSYEAPDAGPKGELVASRVRAQSNVWKFPVTGDPADNANRGVPITRQTGQVQTVTVSPDESEVAFLSDNGGHANVWIARISDGEMRPLTRESDPRYVIAVPYWSPRGDLINFLSDRNSPTADVTLWVSKADGSDLRDLGIKGAWACWSGDGQWIYFSTAEKGVSKISKVRVDGGQPQLVRDDNSVGCAASPDGSVFYYLKILTQAGGAWDYEIRAASPEGGASKVLGRVAGARIPVGAINAQLYLSPDEKWLAMPLADGSTVNLWALPTAGGEWRKLTDFGTRNVVISRRIGWSKDSKSLYASLADVDSDIIMFSGLKW